ncbi:hypothetical protein BDV95DRAFT_385119 [Massariosphaeria phaeospora]|uniref:Uncharacterized protein n=1 Tax=Massariosphaeria phaeospora TaxID=100035 RepID=A0A7C8MQD4_9PLEO|nr:hypothetical protein BDV95DRAFT_385119 [Massariosphaeria phaeospora]
MHVASSLGSSIEQIREVRPAQLIPKYLPIGRVARHTPATTVHSHIGPIPGMNSASHLSCSYSGLPGPNSIILRKEALSSESAWNRRKCRTIVAKAGPQETDGVGEIEDVVSQEAHIRYALLRRIRPRGQATYRMWCHVLPWHLTAAETHHA